MHAIMEGNNDSRPRKPHAVDLRTKLEGNDSLLLGIVPDDHLAKRALVMSGPSISTSICSYRPCFAGTWVVSLLQLMLYN